MQLRNARAVIFDLDGTLADSLSDIATHLNAALVDHGLAARSHDEITKLVGHGAEYLVRRAVGDDPIVATVLATFRTRYRAQPIIETKLFAGLEHVLDQLASRKLGVLSNKPHALTVTISEALLARWPFGAIAGQRPDRPIKPDPEALRAVARELRLDVAECVLVGDSEVDIETARAAGAISIGVTWGLRPHDVVVAAAPDHIVHTPAELADLFT